MFDSGDIVIRKKIPEVLMTVKANFNDSSICQWFEIINGEYTELRAGEFNDCDLILYTKYIREKKLNTLIDEESRETTYEV